eukprot:Skav223484  [mRNA]  locus=scaffold643:26859:28559:- [translate_table: standard]
MGNPWDSAHTRDSLPRSRPRSLAGRVSRHLPPHLEPSASIPPTVALEVQGLQHEIQRPDSREPLPTGDNGKFR